MQRLVDTLQDNAARANLVQELRALIAVQRNIPAPRPAGIALLGQLSQQIDAFTGEILAGAAIIVDAPRLVGWAREQISDAAARQRWIEAAYAFVLVFGLAGAAEWALRWMLARARPKFPVRRRDTHAVRGLFALLGLVLDLVPILVFAAIAYSAVSMALDPLTATRITLSVLVDATVEARLILCLARAMLLPADDGALFVPIDAETRNYLYIWVKRFTFWGIYGYAVPEAAWWLGIPGALYTLLLKLAGLVLALLAAVFLLQNQAPIAAWIAGDGNSASGWGRIRRTIAEIWPLLAIFYIVGIYAIYALHIEGGFLYVLRATVMSIVVIIAARLVVHSIQQPEPARLCRLAAAQGEISDIGAARQPLYPDPDRARQRHRLYPGRADRAAGLGCAGVRLVRLRLRPAGRRAAADDRPGDAGRTRRVGGLRIGDRALSEPNRRQPAAAAHPHPHPAALAAHRDAVAARGPRFG